MKITDAIEHFGSQQKLADFLGITPSAISRWKERGEDIPISSAIRLANLTGGAIDLRLRDYQDATK